MSNFFVSSLKISNNNETYEDNLNNYKNQKIPKLNINNKKLCSNNKNDYTSNSNYNNVYPNLISSQLILRKLLQKTEDSLIKMLILEIQKEKIPNKYLSKEINITNSNNVNSSYRNIPLMLEIIKKIFSFQKFLYINNINDKYLNNILNNFEYLQIPKNKYIFNKNDFVDYFYLIIQGKVHIESIINEKNEYERKFSVLNEGDCFGEWELLENKIIRNSSSFCLENCDLFYLTKDNFNSYLMKIMKKNINAQRNFIFQTIPPFYKTNLLEIIDKTLDKIVLKKNDILYYEGDPAKYLYIIYDGEFAVKRNFFQIKDRNYNCIRKCPSTSNMNCINTINFDVKNFKHNKKEYEYYLKLPIMLNLTKGEFIGLESIKNYKLYYEKVKEIELKKKSNKLREKLSSNLINKFEQKKSRNIFFNNKLNNNLKNKKKNNLFINYSNDDINPFKYKKQQILNNKKNNNEIDIEIEYKYHYNTTIIAKRDFNLVYRLQPKVIAHNVFNFVNKHFNKIVKNRNSIIDSYLKNYYEISKSTRIIYREELIQNQIIEEKNGVKKIIKNINFTSKNMKDKKPNFIKTLITQFKIKSINNNNNNNLSNKNNLNNQINNGNFKKLFLNKLNYLNKVNQRLNNSSSKILLNKNKTNRISNSNPKINHNKSSEIIFSLNKSFNNNSQNINIRNKSFFFNSGNYCLPLYSNIMNNNLI